MTIEVATSQFGKCPPGHMGVRVSQGKGFGRIDAVLREAMPSVMLLEDYKRGRCGWPEYEERYAAEIEWAREALSLAVPSLVVDAETAGFRGLALMCYEASPENCHRRLLAGWVRDSGILGGYDVEFAARFR